MIQKIVQEIEERRVPLNSLSGFVIFSYFSMSLILRSTRDLYGICSCFSSTIGLSCSSFCLILAFKSLKNSSFMSRYLLSWSSQRSSIEPSFECREEASSLFASLLWEILFSWRGGITLFECFIFFPIIMIVKEEFSFMIVSNEIMKKRAYFDFYFRLIHFFDWGCLPCSFLSCSTLSKNLVVFAFLVDIRASLRILSVFMISGSVLGIVWFSMLRNTFSKGWAGKDTVKNLEFFNCFISLLQKDLLSVWRA